METLSFRLGEKVVKYPLIIFDFLSDPCHECIIYFVKFANDTNDAGSV